MEQAAVDLKPLGAAPGELPEGTDLIEWYYERGYSDGFPLVPPTEEKLAATVDALGGDAKRLLCKVPPRWGGLTREVLAINMVMAGCRPEYAPVVEAAILALCHAPFNLNGVQATTHMASPLLVVNGPVRREIGMNAGCNVFGSGNRANATIGRALRLVLLNVGGGWPGLLDKSTLGHPGKYTYCIAENEEESPLAPYHVEKGFRPEDSTVFVMAAEPPHSVTNHFANDPEGILDSICSAMSTICNNNAVSAGHCAVVLGPEHARTIARHGWRRQDIRYYLWAHSGNKWQDLYGRGRGTSVSPTPARRSCRRRTTFISLSRAGRPGVFRPLSRAGATCLRPCCAASTILCSRRRDRDASMEPAISRESDEKW